MRRAIALLGICLIAAFGFPSKAEAKSYSVPSVAINATVNPNGSMDVHESYVYRFDGTFSRVTRPVISSELYNVTDFKVSEGGRPLAVDGAPYNASWAISAFNDEHTFDVSFHVERAVRVGPDVGELYWQFVGKQHPFVSNCTITVVFPTGGLKAWAHGPTGGRVAINGNRVMLAVGFIPVDEFVEARVVAPTSSFTATPSGSPRLPTVQSQEVALVRDTLKSEGYSDAEIAQLGSQAFGSPTLRDERAQKLQLLSESRARRSRLVPEIIVMTILAVLGWITYLLLWLKWGNDPKPEHDPGEYWRELPTESPAVVAKYTGDGNPFAATIVDLAQRGYLRIDTTHADGFLSHNKLGWTFNRLKSIDGLVPHEVQVMELLFHHDGSGSDVITSEELRKWASHNREVAHDLWVGFTDAVDKLEDAQGFRAQNGPLPYLLNIIAAGVVGVIAILVFFDNLVVGAVGVASAAALLASTYVLERKTPHGVQRLGEFNAFGRFLRDFSELEHAPAEHVQLWERYLVYSVALGVSAALAKGLALKVPEVAQNGVGWYGGGIDDIGRIALLSTFSHDFQTESTPQSSGANFSGGGGSFSMGGGGGGGGGGFGAS